MHTLNCKKKNAASCPMLSDLKRNDIDLYADSRLRHRTFCNRTLRIMRYNFEFVISPIWSASDPI